jgi:hypothetical protein
MSRKRGMRHVRISITTAWQPMLRSSPRLSTFSCVLACAARHMPCEHAAAAAQELDPHHQRVSDRDKGISWHCREDMTASLGKSNSETTEDVRSATAPLVQC